LEKADSTLVVMQSKLAYSDSLLQASTKVKTIEEKTPWYKQLFSTLKNILLGVIIGMVLLVMLIAATKKHWNKLINTK
jgi:predicted DNA repair protein MutK